MQTKSSLNQLQRAFKACVKRESEDLDWVLPKTPLSNKKRIDIYGYAYWARLEEAIKDDFESIVELLGDAKFSEISKQYFKRYPSKYKSVSDVGRNFSLFLKTHKILEKHPYLAELADFEWAKVQCFYAPESKRHGLEDIQNKTEEDWATAKLILDKSVLLKQYSWPVIEIAEELKTDSTPQNNYVLFYKINDNFEYEPIPEWKFKLLLKLKCGHSLTEATHFLSTEGLENIEPSVFSYWITHSIIHSIEW